MAASGVAGLSRELARLVAEVVGDDEYGVDTVDEAIRVLSTLRGLVSDQHEKPPSSGLDEAAVPQEFLCPISRRLMQEPVVVETGQVRFLLPSLDSPLGLQWVGVGAFGFLSHGQALKLPSLTAFCRCS